LSRRHTGVCEGCGERRRTRPRRIDFAGGDDDRNRAWLCDGCVQDLKAGILSRKLLRGVVDDREDAKLRREMDHAAYAREGHGAVRQIRGG